ncbi:hypothetical protein [Mesorhizobium sp.]|uniref:hypothetical protein n=1 Tax=Mesorhizobium sp. TaxID=1871066 RepID=UPI001204D40E|nr:hypothetical protein [Mesorhizobium sp.]TIL46971.1 MAG: hypothetical protein E5Y86_04360 [Mesorhizobium sp.]
MPVNMDRLEDNPVEIPKGGIKYFDIVGNNLLTADSMPHSIRLAQNGTMKLKSMSMSLEQEEKKDCR